MPSRMSIGLWRRPPAHLANSGCRRAHAAGPDGPSYDQSTCRDPAPRTCTPAWDSTAGDGDASARAAACRVATGAVSQGLRAVSLSSPAPPGCSVPLLPSVSARRRCRRSIGSSAPLAAVAGGAAGATRSVAKPDTADEGDAGPEAAASGAEAPDAAVFGRLAFFGLCTGVRGHSGSAGHSAYAAAPAALTPTTLPATITSIFFDSTMRGSGSLRRTS